MHAANLEKLEKEKAQLAQTVEKLKKEATALTAETYALRDRAAREKVGAFLSCRCTILIIALRLQAKVHEKLLNLSSSICRVLLRKLLQSATRI